MDTRLIFRDRSWTTKSALGAGQARSSAPIGQGASKPAAGVPSGATREGWATSGFRARGSRLKLASEKSQAREAASARTADRHGWPGARAPRWTGESSLRN
jgi:hypothetical protein